MASEDFVTGDPIWAKMKGFPVWPAKIVDPPTPKSSKPKASYVSFFGTGDYAWILNKNIIPHRESILAEAKSRKKPPTNYLNGIDEFVKYLKVYKRVKQPKIKKKTIKNNDTKSSVKVTKALDSFSNKYDGRELNKSLKKAKAQSKSSSKIRNISPSHFSPISDLHSPLLQNKPVHGKSKREIPSGKKIGFIGLGTMGKKLVNKLLIKGYDVTLWNKTLSLCDTFVDMGAKKACSPAELIMKCDITFCCIAGPEASKTVFFGEDGILHGLEQAQNVGLAGKGYIEMTTIDPATSQNISEAVSRNGGTYLEAPIIGSSKEVEERNITIPAAGDCNLFTMAAPYLNTFGKNVVFVTCNVGEAAQMNLALSSVAATAIAALAEAMVMIERLNLQKSDFIEYMNYGPLGCKKMTDAAQAMNDLKFPKVTALKHAQKDISLTMSMAAAHSQPMTVIAAANEIYKRGKRMYYANDDMTAVYKAVKY